MSISKQTLKRKQHDMKSMIKIIQEYDEQVAKEGKVNKAQFASKHGLTKSNKAKVVSLKKLLTYLNK